MMTSAAPYPIGSTLMDNGRIYTVIACRLVGTRGYNVTGEDKHGYWRFFWFPIEVKK